MCLKTITSQKWQWNSVLNTLRCPCLAAFVVPDGLETLQLQEAVNGSWQWSLHCEWLARGGHWMNLGGENWQIWQSAEKFVVSHGVGSIHLCNASSPPRNLGCWCFLECDLAKSWNCSNCSPVGSEVVLWYTGTLIIFDHVSICEHHASRHRSKENYVFGATILWPHHEVRLCDIYDIYDIYEHWTDAKSHSNLDVLFHLQI